MALVNLATLWKPKKPQKHLVLVGDSKDKKHTYMVFRKTSKDGKWVFYDLCEQVEGESPPAETDEASGGGEDEDDLPF